MFSSRVFVTCARHVEVEWSWRKPDWRGERSLCSFWEIFRFSSCLFIFETYICCESGENLPIEWCRRYWMTSKARCKIDFVKLCCNVLIVWGHILSQKRHEVSLTYQEVKKCIFWVKLKKFSGKERKIWAISKKYIKLRHYMLDDVTDQYPHYMKCLICIFIAL